MSGRDVGDDNQPMRRKKKTQKEGLKRGENIQKMANGKFLEDVFF